MHSSSDFRSGPGSSVWFCCRVGADRRMHVACAGIGDEVVIKRDLSTDFQDFQTRRLGIRPRETIGIMIGLRQNTCPDHAQTECLGRHNVDDHRRKGAGCHNAACRGIQLCVASCAGCPDNKRRELEVAVMFRGILCHIPAEEIMPVSQRHGQRAQARYELQGPTKPALPSLLPCCVQFHVSHAENSATPSLSLSMYG